MFIFDALSIFGSAGAILLLMVPFIALLFNLGQLIYHSIASRIKYPGRENKRFRIAYLQRRGY